VLPVLAALGAIACGVITLQPDPTAPVNACTDDLSCAKTFPEAGIGSCTSGTCSGTSFAPFLVVATPADQVGLGGATVAIPLNYAQTRAQLAQKSKLPPTPTCLNAQLALPATECDPIPPLGTFNAGTLQVASGFDTLLVPPGGLRPNNPAIAGATTAMPVNVTVELLWQDPATGKFAPARKLGIALDDLNGTIASGAVKTDPFLNGPTNGTAVVNGYEYEMNVPQPLSPSDPTNAYRFYVTPPDPYVGVPPLVRVQTLPLLEPGFAPVGQSLLGQSEALKYDTPPPDGGASTIKAHNYQINEAPGAPSLEGWTAHIDDQNGHRVSGTITLAAGTSKSVTLYEATGTTSQGSVSSGGDPDRYLETLYIDPPKGVALPRYAAPAIAGQINGPFIYPALPNSNKPVTLEGYVLTSDTLQKVQDGAQVLFLANGDTDFLVEADLSTQTPLLFSKTVAATSLGQYAIDVYPGTLRVYIVPDNPELALTSFDKQVGGAPVQQGVSLQVNRRTHVKGRVVLPNGMPVFAADVIITASADSPFLPKDDPLARPREVRGTTDTSGLFDIASDPGFVDISIRPHDATNFPWVVLTNRVVPPNDGSSDAGAQVTFIVGDVVIPEPSRYTQAAAGVLTDSIGNPIVHAVVRAYAFPPLGTGIDGGAPQTRGARLLGMTVTDDNAKFQLFVVPPQ
jgi:hypothetical protein